MAPPRRTDVEGQPHPTTNPYTGMPPTLPPLHPLNVLRRLAYISVSCFGLHKFNLVPVILQSPHISHEWFKIGLAATIALVGIKAYLEIFEGKVHKKQVNYHNYPQTTHASIAIFLLAAVAFHASLWPHYRWNAMVVLLMLFFGVILQLMLFLPTWLQNVLSVIVLTFFLQQYA